MNQKKIRIEAFETIYWFSDEFGWSLVKELEVCFQLERLLRELWQPSSVSL